MDKKKHNQKLKKDLKPVKTQVSKPKKPKKAKSDSAFSHWIQLGHLHRRMSFQAWKRMGLAPISSFMTVLVLGITLSLPTTLSMALDNLRVMVGDAQMNSVRISLYLSEGVNDAQAQELYNTLLQDNDVASAVYISPDDGVKEFAEYSGLGKALQLLDSNPLPGVIEVEPRNISPLVVQNLQIRLKRLQGIDEIQVDSAWLKRLNTLLSIGERTLVGLSVMIGLTVLLAIGGITHLLVVSRKDEIQVVKLVGGTDGYVMLPFLYGGFWYGLLGGVTCWLIVMGFWFALSNPVVELSTLYQQPFQPAYPSWQLLLGLAGGTAVTGVIGSMAASWQQLRLIEP